MHALSSCSTRAAWPMSCLPRGVPVYEVAPPGGTTMNLRELPSRFAMLLIVPQSGTEHVLQTRADELGVLDRAAAPRWSG